MHMTIVGAAFSSESAARAAEHDLTEQLGLAPGAMELAPLGAVGRKSEDRHIVAAHVPATAIQQATQIIVRHGGVIVTEVSRAAPTGVGRTEAGAPARH
jgi:hypothetical protein